MHDPKRQELFKILVCVQRLPYRKVAEMMGISENQVKYWAKKLC